MAFGVSRGFRPQLCHFLVLCPWESYLISLSLHFCIYNINIKILCPTPIVKIHWKKNICGETSIKEAVSKYLLSL